MPGLGSREQRSAIRDLRREMAEWRAAHADSIKLALIGALPNKVGELIDLARECGWSVSCERASQGSRCGTVRFEHPSEAQHSYSLSLPMPDDERKRAAIVAELRMRIGSRPMAA